MTHIPSSYKLHSHSVAYGSGSGQQSVTGLPDADDPESLWIIKGAHGESCPRGEPIECGSVIRLKHSGTNKFLHSHHHRSPISKQQEVSAFDGLDTGDNWKVICLDKSTTYWLREQKFQLLHVETSAYLFANEEYVYNNPISGQIEVSATKKTGENTEWAQECEKLIMVQANDSERSKYIKDSMTNDKRLDAISKEKPKLKSDQWIRVDQAFRLHFLICPVFCCFSRSTQSAVVILQRIYKKKEKQSGRDHSTLLLIYIGVYLLAFM
ncbi:2776_t:CDS:2 [Rhizophagus irregularis]|nr:2776_t:CDS:2 [Rhizophagus irregularis]